MDKFLKIIKKKHILEEEKKYETTSYFSDHVANRNWGVYN